MGRLVDLTMSLDTSIYANGDVLAEVQALGCGAGLLKSLTLIDKDDQKAALDIYFFSAAVVLGTENGAPSISDADCLECLGVVPIAAADYKDLGGVSMAIIKNIDMILKPVVDTQNVYIGMVNGSGTPTYTAAGMKLRLGIE